MADHEPDDDNDDALVVVDGARVQSLAIDRRITERRRELLRAFAVPEDLFPTLCLLSDPATHRRITALLEAVDVPALTRAYQQIWRDEHAAALWPCGVCRTPTARADMVLVRYTNTCRNCDNERRSRPSQPPPNGLRSALARARRARLPATLTKAEWQRTVTHFGDRCAYCGGPWYVVEHATPIPLGGGTTASNCVPACPSCNATKGSDSLEALLVVDQTPTYLPPKFSRVTLEAVRTWLVSVGRKTP